MNPNEEQPPHSADPDGFADAVAARLATITGKKKPREKKPRVVLSPNRKGPPIYMLYSGKIAIRTERGWVEAHAKVAKNVLIGAGLTEPDARHYAAELPPAASIMFDPRTTEPIVEKDGERWLNTFSGMPPVGPAGDYMMVTSLIGHLVNHDEEGYEYLLDWIAAPLQSLHEGRGSKRNLSAIVFVGNEGTGKGMVALVFEQIYGSDHTVKMDQSALEDLFTPTGLESALFVVANEVTSRTNRGDEHVMNKMKEWITEDRIPMRRMHAASQTIPVHFNMIFTTNNVRHPVKISDGDRRYTVFDQPEKLPDATRDAFIADRVAGWPQVRAFAAAMLARKVTHDLTRPLETDARDVVKAASKEPATAFAEWLAEVGIEVAAEEWVVREKAKHRAAGYEGDLDEITRPWSDTKNGRFVPSRIMAQIFGYYCAAFHPKARPIESLASALKKVGIIGDQRQKFRGSAHVGYMPVPASVIDPKPAAQSAQYDPNWKRVAN